MENSKKNKTTYRWEKFKYFLKFDENVKVRKKIHDKNL